MSYTKTTEVNFVNPRSLINYQWNPDVGWVTLAGASVTMRNTVWLKTQTGEKVEDYQQKIRDGVNAGSPYVVNALRVEIFRPVVETIVSHEAFAGPPDNKWQSYVKSKFSGCWVQPDPVNFTHLAVASSKAEADALTKTYNKVRSEYQRLNAAASVVEFGDVIRQFGKPMDAIIDLTNRRLNRLYLESRGLKGSVAFRKIKYAQIVASTYLEYAFGLAPLISDTEKIAEALARFNTEKQENYRFRSRIVSRGSNETATHTESEVRFGSFSMCAAKAVDKKKTEVSVQYVCGLTTKHIADFGSAERLKQLCGFQPADWVPALWEVVPWSWLIDYFTNISNILDAAATSTHGVSWINKTVRTRTVLTQTTTVDHGGCAEYLPAGVRYSGSTGESLGSFEVVRTSLTRSQPTSLGVPPLVFEHPFGDLKKIANMAAVLISRKPTNSGLWLGIKSS